MPLDRFITTGEQIPIEIHYRSFILHTNADMNFATWQYSALIAQKETFMR